MTAGGLERGPSPLALACTAPLRAKTLWPRPSGQDPLAKTIWPRQSGQDNLARPLARKRDHDRWPDHWPDHWLAHWPDHCRGHWRADETTGAHGSPDLCP